MSLNEIRQFLKPLMERVETITFVGGMRELSILAVLLSMLCISLAMKMPSDKEKKEKKGKKDKDDKPSEEAKEEPAPTEEGAPAPAPEVAPAPESAPAPAPAEESAPDTALPTELEDLGPIAVIEAPPAGDENAL